MRQFSGKKKQIISFFAFSAALFQMYAAINPLETFFLRCTHLTVFMALAYLLYPPKKNSPDVPFPLFDKFMILMVVISGTYCVYYYPIKIADMLGNISTLEIVIGSLIIFSIIEATRRTVGVVFPILIIIALLYSFWGNFLPFMSCRGYSLTRVIWHQVFTTEGIFGITIGVTSSYVVLFVIFGVMMKNLGGSDFFMELAHALVGRFRGGPAKMAIVASASFGTISGSAVANVVGTGSFTIPMMKKFGYKSHFAGAVEASASIAGQITPPVMGAVAFIMAELLQISYARVCLAALLPAVFYYISLFMAVDIEAVKQGLKGQTDITGKKSIVKIFVSHWTIITSLVLLVTLLLFRGWSPARSIFFTIIFMLAAILIEGLIKKRQFLHIIKEIYEAAVEGVFASSMVVCLVAGAGIVVGTVSLTGVGLKFSTLLLNISGGILLVLLVLTMLASIVLGMGMPSTALYIVVSTLLAPPIVVLGVPVISAHLFVFYAGLLAGVTPPVAVPAYVAASIAQADPYKTAGTAFLLALPAMLVMYAFVYHPAFVFIGSPLSILEVFVSTIVSIYAVICGLQGCSSFYYKSFKPFVRVLLLILGTAGVLTVGIGSLCITLVLFVGLIVIPLFKLRKSGRANR